ncbi:MAG: cohesin domain-containing protein [Chloroflexi bacterium]|nr:cohesin domain-containing protein [Chloroflexota bacterium]
MRWFFEVASIGIVSSWRWLLGLVIIVGALVGILFAAGVFGGGEETTLVTAPTPTPTPASSGVPDPTSTPEATVISVPILATQAKNVGSLEFVLVYDQAKLEFVQVEPGVLTGSALIDWSSTEPGRVWAAIIDIEGISGSGPVAVVKFNLREPVAGLMPLTVEDINAFDASTLVDIITTTTPGQFNGASLALLSPLVTFQ